ncbi:MAG: extracellular solute-binding protein [Rhizobiaceae bacterium]|nr:extracellular solute-binding protein [Rhizobiaceae bacterium]
MSIFRKFSLACATLLAFGGLTAAAYAEDTVESIYEAAKKEGKVVLWTAHDPEFHALVAAEFAKQFPGIEVESFKIQPAPAIERAITEQQAGKLSVDIIDHSNVSYIPLLNDRGLTEPYDWVKVFNADPDRVLFDGRALLIGQYDYPIVYNTDLVKPEEITSWDSLLDPKWKGKIVLEARGFNFQILAQEWGEEKTLDYVKKLMANEPIISKGGGPTRDAVASGQAYIAVGAQGSLSDRMASQGAPLAWARVGPIPAALIATIPIKGAPHPNAAKLYAYFWTTKVGQQIYYDWEKSGILTGSTPTERGREMQDKGIQIVVESTDIERGRDLLKKMSQAIGGLQQ